MNSIEPHYWKANIGADNGFVPSGNKHYLSQYLPRSMSPCGIFSPQWFRLLTMMTNATNQIWLPHFLTHWGRVTHICVSRLTITGSDNGLSPGRCQAIIWTNARLLLIGPLGTNFSENLIEILTFWLTEMRLKVSSAKCRPFCLGLNVLKWDC